METTPHIEAFRSDLVGAAGMGGDEAVRLAEQLGRAVEPALRLRFLDVLSEAALELNEQLPRGQVDVRVAGRDAVLTYVESDQPEPQPTPTPPEDEQAARITLRLPDSLKGRAEAAAVADGVSLNTWLVKAIARSLDGDTRKTTPGRRLTGYARG